MNISDNDQRAQGLFDCVVVFEEWYAGLQVCKCVGWMVEGLVATLLGISCILLPTSKHWWIADKMIWTWWAATSSAWWAAASPTTTLLIKEAVSGRNQQMKTLVANRIKTTIEACKNKHLLVIMRTTNVEAWVYEELHSWRKHIGNYLNRDKATTDQVSNRMIVRDNCFSLFRMIVWDDCFSLFRRKQDNTELEWLGSLQKSRCNI